MIIQKVFHFIKALLYNTIWIVIHMPVYIKRAAYTTVIFLSFFLVLIFFMASLAVKVFQKVPVLNIIVNKLIFVWDKTLGRFYNILFDKLEALRPFKIRRKYLVRVAFQNLLIRKSRSLVTIFGMAVGVGIIVYLLSLGYGIEKLVISQVSSLEELKMVDVTPGESSRVVLNEEILKRITKIKSVTDALPIISVVGRMNYNKAKIDILVYAVPYEYLQMTKPTLLTGKYFDKKYQLSNGLSSQGQVAGEQVELEKAQLGKPIKGNVTFFNILPGVTAPIWKECSMESDLLGVTVRNDSDSQGVQYWGTEYAPFIPHGRAAYDSQQRQYAGKWIRAEFPIYTQTENNTVEKKLQGNGLQEWQYGCVQRNDVQIVSDLSFAKGDVLGESTVEYVLAASDSAVLDSSSSATLATVSDVNFSGSTVATNEAGLEVVYLQEEASAQKKEKLLEFRKPVSGEAVISTGLMNLLGIPQNKVSKESFDISFIIVRSLMPGAEGRVLTKEVKYKITGVVEDNDSQFIYIPIQDISVLGVSNYSQAKLVLDQPEQMAEVRKQVETMGYKTSSTADTVEQIEGFFNSVRGVLGILGFIALGVASLGMFNTLTVSLLERTREIGGMKTMGMVSGEIQELFLAEAMIMGFAGGLSGLFLGVFVGKVTSYIVSFFAIAQGIGFLELTYVPLNLTIFIIASSFVVGLSTGLYPAYRAKKISALNALRYE